MTQYGKLTLILVAVAMVVALAFVDPTSPAWHIHCPFYTLTGLRCPGCGNQRALHSLLSGQLYKAIGYNLFLVIALPYAVALLVTGMLPRRHALTALRRWLRSKAVVAAFVGTFCVWMVVRNILQI